jgi:hypothetical protein
MIMSRFTLVTFLGVKNMANVSLYIEALATFSDPVSAKEVHTKAAELFGAAVQGDVSSARQSLERYVLRNKVEKHGTKYRIGMAFVDPLGAAMAQNKALRIENDKLKQRIAELESVAK